MKVRCPGPAWGVPPLLGAGTPGWVPGQHIYVKQSITPNLPRSPFTVVSLPPLKGQNGGDIGSNIDLVVRNLGGPNTSWLASKPNEAGRNDRNVDLLLEGPYGQSKKYISDLLERRDSSGSVMLVAGGIGATFTLPIYLSLLINWQSTRNIHFIWIVKSLQEAQWGIEMLETAKVPEIAVTIYITKEADIPSEKESAPDSSHGLKILRNGRPDLSMVVDDIFIPKVTKEKSPGTPTVSHSRVTVLACGPPAMMRSLRQEVGRHVMGYGRDVAYHEETFGLGA